eukprot:2008277-Lingulodinium_polyedra.AAC.1
MGSACPEQNGLAQRRPRQSRSWDERDCPHFSAVPQSDARRRPKWRRSLTNRPRQWNREQTRPE